MPLWAIVALLAAGAFAGFIEPGRLSSVFGTATLYIFLPPLLFEAAWNLDARVMLVNRRPIFALAVPGVLITTVVVGAAVMLGGFALLPALIVGAMVSATDPIAIVAIFRKLPVPIALATIVQSEALLNDAMAVVVYRALVVAAAGAIGATSVAIVTAVAITGAVTGILGGVVLATLVAYVALRRNGPLVQILASTAGAYLAYYAAESVHASGIFAVIAFGIALREFERRSISVLVSERVAKFWDAGAMLANACVFFLTGAAVELSRLAHEPFKAAAAIFGVLVARLVLAYVVTPIAIGRTVNRAWLSIVRAAGARGALSLALALALPVWIPLRAQIIDVTFAVVLATLLSSVLLVPHAMKRFARAGGTE